ncbi:hypothetical protein GYMLUDRAFT_244537 [Collybiopsis luxurians FD-317 M1]|uniref:Uncharacterized protein n=1 Tax=Collybiopsis luxurians FD-317 M1 TaxID=944289 RepID=A0A0D0CN36_9AGAR|nr:hypothetical protein GYMLUDRAFT_244537 [Collybiopsis luxurians FD-317 M1]
MSIHHWPDSPSVLFLTSLALCRRLKSTETQKWNVTAEKAFIQGTGEREILTKEGRVGEHYPVSRIQGEFGIGNLAKFFAGASSTSTSTVAATDSCNSSTHGSSSDASHSYTPSFSQQQFENMDLLKERALQLAIEKIYQESGAVKKVFDPESGRKRSKLCIKTLDRQSPKCQARGTRRERWVKMVAIIQLEGELFFVPQTLRVCVSDGPPCRRDGCTPLLRKWHHPPYQEILKVRLSLTDELMEKSRCLSDMILPRDKEPFRTPGYSWLFPQSIDESDGKSKFWSEANVSDKLDLALRLLLECYTLRWATHSQGGCQFDCSGQACEVAGMRTPPYSGWWRRGPVSKQLQEFMQSAALGHYKTGVSAYMFSYCHIAAAATVRATLNYLLIGLGADPDRCYLHSFEILLASVVMFPALGNLSFTLLEYRLGHRAISSNAIKNLSWIPFFLFFFGSLSIRLSAASLAHTTCAFLSLPS